MDFFGDLSIEVLDYLLQFLDGKSLANLLKTNHRFRNLCSREVYWQKLCGQDFIIDSLPSSFKQWYQCYGYYYGKFGFLGINTYRKIRRAWNKIEKFYSELESDITFEDGATKEDIQLFQQRLGSHITLPKDYICSLMIHNGQKIDEHVLNGLSSGCFGSLYAYDDYKTEFLASTTNVLIAQNHIAADQNNCDISLICLTIAVTNRFWSNSHYLCTTLSVPESSEIVFGNVISSPQLRHRYSQPSWKIANDFTEWLEEFANGLYEHRFALSFNEPVTDNNELLRYYFNDGCEAKYGAFSCKVHTAFIPESSVVTQPRFFFTYRITLSMDDDADEAMSCKLESRHWVITDGHNNEEKVDGPGVIGFFPVLKYKFTFFQFLILTFIFAGQETNFHMLPVFTFQPISVKCQVFSE